jgi:hypothetical protein
MSALMCPASVAVTDPRPFLLEDHFTAIGQLCIVRDEDWDEVVAKVKEWDVNDTLTIIDTEAGPFLTVAIPSKGGGYEKVEF